MVSHELQEWKLLRQTRFNSLTEARNESVIQGLEHLPGDKMRSCCGCLTFRCSEEIDSEDRRIQFVWRLMNETDIDSRCCLNCEGEVFPEGSQMGPMTKESGECETGVKRTCVYNPGKYFIQMSL